MYIKYTYTSKQLRHLDIIDICQHLSIPNILIGKASRKVDPPGAFWVRLGPPGVPHILQLTISKTSCVVFMSWLSLCMCICVGPGGWVRYLSDAVPRWFVRLRHLSVISVELCGGRAEASYPSCPALPYSLSPMTDSTSPRFHHRAHSSASRVHANILCRVFSGISLILTRHNKLTKKTTPKF